MRPTHSPQTAPTGAFRGLSKISVLGGVAGAVGELAALCEKGKREMSCTKTNDCGERTHFLAQFKLVGSIFNWRIFVTCKFET